jgi:hypothetical protein
MTINPYWEQSCEHRWDRLSSEPDMREEGDLSATVELAPELVARLPGFKGKWVYTCWIKEECAAWIGPFESAQDAMTACESHFDSNHRNLFWPDKITVID